MSDVAKVAFELVWILACAVALLYLTLGMCRKCWSPIIRTKRIPIAGGETIIEKRCVFCNDRRIFRVNAEGRLLDSRQSR